jgi:hypothetical protein
MKKNYVNSTEVKLSQHLVSRCPDYSRNFFSLAYANIQPVIRNERANTIISLPFLQANCVEVSGGVAANYLTAFINVITNNG